MTNCLVCLPVDDYQSILQHELPGCLQHSDLYAVLIHHAGHVELCHPPRRGVIHVEFDGCHGGTILHDE